MRLSELVTEFFENLFKLPPVVLPEPPPLTEPPPYATDEALDNFRAAIVETQERQLEELLEFYAETIAGAADATDLDLEELL